MRKFLEILRILSGKESERKVCEKLISIIPTCLVHRAPCAVVSCSCKCMTLVVQTFSTWNIIKFYRADADADVYDERNAQKTILMCAQHYDEFFFTLPEFPHKVAKRMEQHKVYAPELTSYRNSAQLTYIFVKFTRRTQLTYFFFSCHSLEMLCIRRLQSLVILLHICTVIFQVNRKFTNIFTPV